MAGRIPRAMSEGDYYHIMVRGVAKMALFHDDKDRNVFLKTLREALDARQGELHAWCLMDNHVHLVLRMTLPEISRLMHDVELHYAKYFNARNDRVGHVFQGRFKSQAINDDKYYLTCIRYVHRNPEKAGLAKTDSYPWSSYAEYLGKPGLCATSFALEMFGGLSGFIGAHKEDVAMVFLDVDEDRRLAVEAVCSEVCLKYNLGSVRDVSEQAPKIRNEIVVSMKEQGLRGSDVVAATGVSSSTVSRLK